MRKISRSDIVHELIELSRELMKGVTLALGYYRASAYKHEAVIPINHKLTQLRLLAELIAGSVGFDPFLDFDASQSHGNVAIAPGECLFSTRVLSLLAALRDILAEAERQASSLPADEEFAQRLRQHRHELGHLCPPGSRPWHLLQSL